MKIRNNRSEKENKSLVIRASICIGIFVAAIMWIINIFRFTPVGHAELIGATVMVLVISMCLAGIVIAPVKKDTKKELNTTLIENVKTGKWKVHDISSGASKSIAEENIQCHIVFEDQTGKKIQYDFPNGFVTKVEYDSALKRNELRQISDEEWALHLAFPSSEDSNIYTVTMEEQIQHKVKIEKGYNALKAIAEEEDRISK